MIIGNKSGLSEEQLNVALKKGCKYIEFHTERSDFDNEINVDMIVDKLNSNNVICHSIHAPFMNKSNFFGLDEYEKEKQIYYIKQSIELANKVCRLDNPIVVVHFEVGSKLDELEVSKVKIDEYLKEYKKLLVRLDKYLQIEFPNVFITVENLPYFVYERDGQSLFTWFFGINEDLAKLVEELELSNIKTCLDVCHMENVIKIDKIARNSISKDIIYYLRKYKSTLGLIHLSNSIALGELPKYHGTSFTNSEEDIEYLTSFFNGLNEIGINCPITLEIKENNFEVFDKIEETVNVLKDLGYM